MFSSRHTAGWRGTTSRPILGFSPKYHVKNLTPDALKLWDRGWISQMCPSWHLTWVLYWSWTAEGSLFFVWAERHILFMHTPNVSLKSVQTSQRSPMICAPCLFCFNLFWKLLVLKHRRTDEFKEVNWSISACWASEYCMRHWRWNRFVSLTNRWHHTHQSTVLYSICGKWFLAENQNNFDQSGGRTLKSVCVIYSM